ncbi:hypothetical protein ACFQ6N_02500 [Kitasatospora sp. NPDC056446]|uniref:hypothetical protein n=1 Tax=Kitasatospora sp. NPDC056446 TaxID=3345819 RepID=UPI00369E4EB7
MNDRPVEVWRLPEEEWRAGSRAVTWTVGPAGEPAVLLVPERYAAPAGAWPSVGLPFDGEVVVHGPAGPWRVPLTGVGVAPDLLALLPGGRVLLADCRADELADGWEHNGQVFGPDGSPTRSLQLGDDIQALTTDRDGRIWLAFGDEGNYGDNPIGRCGLVGLDTAGRTVWQPDFKQLGDYPLEGLAAATEGRRAWLAWYGERGHLTGIDPAGGEPLTVPLPGRQPMGFAIAGDRAVFLERGGDLIRCEREPRKGWREVRRQRLGALGVLGDLDRVRAYGRDGVLWFRSGNGWYRVEA